MRASPQRPAGRATAVARSARPEQDGARRGPRRRVVIEHVRPVVDCGSTPAKGAVGVAVPVSADIFADGHDLLMAALRHGPAGSTGGNGRRRQAHEEVALEAAGNDRWTGWFTPGAEGAWEFAVLGLPDDYGTWLRDLLRRSEAGQELAVEFLVGAELAAARLERRVPAADATALRALRAALSDASADDGERLRAAGEPGTISLMRRTAAWTEATVAGPYALHVDRPLASFSAWYEMFPRSEGSDPRSGRSGTFATAARRLPAIAEMGFDIVYLPPIHPIGHTHRKGRNNALEAAATDPGSPWAIGSEKGGHDAVHPDLGTLAGFDGFVAEARRHGLEVALDFAVQCSPDHPWVREHPQWFSHRPDGTIRYAENPPKRYQDIYPVNFDTPDREALDAELLRTMLHWVDHGVRVFRVDNPHTKPFSFWQWLIQEVQRRHPDVLFLAEAFTRPRVMEQLAKIGFTQSYTYFTWRTTKEELSEYLTELSQTERADYMRPNFWVNTPDILHESLQRGGPPAFRLRAVLAALTCPSWGMYSGYELCENVPVREGSEEYLDSEKYQLRPRVWDSPTSIAPFIATLNAIRRRHAAAIAQIDTLRVHPIDGDTMLCVSRTDTARSDILLVIVNLDPFSAREGLTWLDLAALNIPDDIAYEAYDELSGLAFTWTGRQNYVRLDPAVSPAHVLHLRPRRTA